MFSLSPPKCRGLWGSREQIQGLSCCGVVLPACRMGRHAPPLLPGMADWNHKELGPVSPQCSHKVQLLSVCFPRINLPWGCCPKIQTYKQTKNPCFVRPQYRWSTSPSKRGYEVSPTQDSDLSAQLVSVKVWLRTQLHSWSHSPQCRSKSPICPSTSFSAFLLCIVYTCYFFFMSHIFCGKTWTFLAMHCRKSGYWVPFYFGRLLSLCLWFYIEW